MMKLNWYFIKKGITDISEIGFCLTACKKDDAISILENKFSIVGFFDLKKEIVKLNSL